VSFQCVALEGAERRLPDRFSRALSEFEEEA
jgi:hypothetical protein